MKKVFLMIVGALCCAWCANAKSKAKVRILSYNVRYLNAPGDEGDFAWSARKEPSFRMIADEKPDVIGFQEPRDSQIDDLINGLPQYGYLKIGRDTGAKPNPGEHLMVMYLKDKYTLLDSGHYWLSTTPNVVSMGWDGKCRRVTVWIKLQDKKSGKKLYYFDTHLDHIGDSARLEGARLNVEKMKEIAGEDAFVVISGDMNADPKSKKTQKFLKPYEEWMNYAREDARRSDDLPTYHGFGKAKPIWIDHFFYRNGTPKVYRTVTSEKYGVKYLSDHYPIIADFEY